MATQVDAPPADGAVADARAYLRLAATDEDALLATLADAALALFEAFTGVAPIAADRVAVLPAACGAWQRLPATPVSAITAVADVGGGALPASAYAIDIDAAGDGWVRITDAGGAARVRVDYRAGLAEGWATLPAAIRQGAVRLVAHLHLHRDEADDAGPPAAVAALWRPWRRMRLR